MLVVVLGCRVVVVVEALGKEGGKTCWGFLDIWGISPFLPILRCFILATIFWNRLNSSRSSHTCCGWLPAPPPPPHSRLRLPCCWRVWGLEGAGVRGGEWDGVGVISRGAGGEI